MSNSADAHADAPADSTGSRARSLLSNFGFQIILGLIVGVLLGLVARALAPAADGSVNWLTGTLKTLGSTYVKLLTVAVVPLVVTAVIASITNLRNVANAARLAGKTLLWFAITAFISVVIGIVLGLVFQPGRNTSVTGAGEAPSSTGSWWAFLTSLVPSNFLGLQAKLSDDSVSVGFNVLQVLVVAAAIGIAALKVGPKAEPFIAFNASLLAIVQKVLWWIIRLAPIGTAALIGTAVATYGWNAIGSLGMFTAAMYVGLLIVGFGVYPLIVRLHGLSVKQFYSGVWPAAQLGFVSRSSIGTLPVTERVTERNLGVPREYSSFAVPLGATTKMDGCAALYPAIAAIFVAQFFHLQLGFTDYLLIVVVSVIGSAATAGTTGATVMLTLTLSTLGLPLAGVGLLLAVEPIIDMGRTALNVTGQALIPTIVAKQEGILDEAAYNAPRKDVYADDSEELATATP